MRALQAEAVLRGQAMTPDLVARAAAAASEEISPIDDVRSTAQYRRQVVAALATDGIARAWEQTLAPRYVGPFVSPEPAGVGGFGSNGHEPTEGRSPHYRTDAPASRRAITLTVNGVARRLRVADNDLLLNILREDLELTGTKYGCGIGECSACTVLIDGRLALACLVLAAAADGSHIRTVEGLAAPDGTLDPLQEAFLDYAALQCGFCTPGMLMTAKSLLEENPHPTEADVRDQLRGNMCRCTGYASIVRAVLTAAES